MRVYSRCRWIPEWKRLALKETTKIAAKTMLAH
jgi:hypothetical protein